MVGGPRNKFASKRGLGDFTFFSSRAQVLTGYSCLLSHLIVTFTENSWKCRRLLSNNPLSSLFTGQFLHLLYLGGNHY